MTQKHFRLLAEAVKDMPLSHDDKVEVAVRLAVVCKTFNSNFNRDRFLTACGVL